MSEPDPTFEVAILKALGIDTEKVFEANIRLQAGKPIIVETKRWVIDSDTKSIGELSQKWSVKAETR